MLLVSIGAMFGRQGSACGQKFVAETTEIDDVERVKKGKLR